jgi:hypothetical protein
VSDSPIPLPADPDDPIALARALRWTSVVLTTAALFLFVFNAPALKNWSASLKPTDVTVALANLAAQWEQRVAGAGLTAPRAIVHDTWAKGRELTFPQKAGPTGADAPQQ